MPRIDGFGETQDVAVRVLVDNRTDLLVESADSIKYFDKSLLAEHGFAALVDLEGAGQRILWDAGGTRTTLTENLKRMEIDPATIDTVALSHGHGDHTTGLTELLRGMGLRAKFRDWKPDVAIEEIERYRQGRQVPIIVHPAAFRERWAIADDGTRHGPALPPPRGEWESLGATVVLAEQPSELGPGCWTTGCIPRRSFEMMGTPATSAYREGSAFLRDDVDDDQAIVMNVRGKGLVVLTGCAHAGIINTVNYAREISGVDEVWAIIGGFHLARATDQEIRRTIEEIKAIKPRLLAPSHCTGLNALCRFTSEMPEPFAQGLVGATFLF